MNWKRVDEHIEPTGYVPETIADKLKRTQEELGRHSKMAMARTIKASVLWCAFGAALGMTGMVYWYEQTPKPQPVVGVDRHIDGAISYANQLTAIDRLADIERRVALLESAKEANTIRAEQRVMEMRAALDKLEKLKAKQDGQLLHMAHGGAGQIATEVTPQPLFTLAPPDTTAFVPRVHVPKEKDGYDLDEIRARAKELGVSKLVVK